MVATQAPRGWHHPREGRRFSARDHRRHGAPAQLACAGGRPLPVRPARHDRKPVPTGRDAAPGRVPDLPPSLLARASRRPPTTLQDRAVRPHRGLGARPQSTASSASRRRRSCRTPTCRHHGRPCGDGDSRGARCGAAGAECLRRPRPALGQWARRNSRCGCRAGDRGASTGSRATGAATAGLRRSGATRRASCPAIGGFSSHRRACRSRSGRPGTCSPRSRPASGPLPAGGGAARRLAQGARHRTRSARYSRVGSARCR